MCDSIEVWNEKQKGRIVMSQVHAVRRNPFSRLLGEAGIAFLCGLIFSGAEIVAVSHE